MLTRDLSGFVKCAIDGDRTTFKKPDRRDEIHGIYIEVEQIPYIARMIPDGFRGYIILHFSAPLKQQETLEKILASKQMKERGIEAVCINQRAHKGNSEFSEASVDLSDVSFNNGVPDVVCAGNTILKNLRIGKGSKKIGRYAFADCAGLEEVFIEDGITEIGDGAFISCTALKQLTLPDSIEKIGKGAFKNCTSLTEIRIPAGVEVIDVSVFENCINLNTIYIHPGVKVIGQDAFKGCRELKIVEIPESVEEIGEGAFENCTTMQTAEIGSGVKSIGNGAFRGCKSLSSVVFNPKKCSVERIGDSAFDGCISLQEFSLPELKKKQQTIGKKAFVGCTGLTDVSIMGVSEIGDSAFKNCNSLSSITFGKKLKSIGDMSFSSCCSLTEIEFPESIEKIGFCAFDGCEKLSKVTFSKKAKIEELEYGTFRDCVSLKEIQLPENLEIIGESVFSECSSLESISIPSKTKKIDERAFLNCTKLKHVIIPKSVTEIGGGAFGRCKGLKELKIHKSSIKGLSRGAFDGYEGDTEDIATNLTLHVIETNKNYEVINGELMIRGKEFSRQIGEEYDSNQSEGQEEAKDIVYGDEPDLPDGIEEHGGVYEAKPTKHKKSIFNPIPIGEIAEEIKYAREKRGGVRALSGESQISLGGILRAISGRRPKGPKKRAKPVPEQLGDGTPEI